MTEPAAAPPLPSALMLTAMNPAFAENPHPLLDDLRERAPIHFDAFLKLWILTRNEDVEAVLRDRELSVDPSKAPPDSFMARLTLQRPDSAPGDRTQQSMLFLDDPDHARLRGLVNRAFTPRAVERMAPRIQQIADELLDRLEGKEEWDLIGDFSAPLPTIVIAEMLGIDAGHQKQFKEWSDLIVTGFDPFLSEEQRAKVVQAGMDMRDYLRRAVEERRMNRGDDLISGMIAAEENGDQLSDEEIVVMVALLLAAGNLTTTDLIGNGMLAFLKNRDQWEKLKADPALLQNAVEEMLRFDPPVTQSGRLALADTSVGGCPVHAGQSVTTVLVAANHDPAVHPNPHAFDISREDTQHVSFGGGRRYCLGAPLARLEAQIAVGTLARRFPNLQLATGKQEWRKVPGFHGLVALPVKPGA